MDKIKILKFFAKAVNDGTFIFGIEYLLMTLFRVDAQTFTTIRFN